MCRICGDAKAAVELENAGGSPANAHDVDCPGCRARYTITGQAENDIDTMTEEQRALLREVAPAILRAWNAAKKRLRIDRDVLWGLLRRDDLAP